MELTGQDYTVYDPNREYVKSYFFHFAHSPGKEDEVFLEACRLFLLTTHSTIPTERIKVERKPTRYVSPGRLETIINFNIKA